MEKQAPKSHSVMEWVATGEELPPRGKVVETKIHDRKGERNIQPLKREGRLWFFPKGSMYVYYTPTHWRHMDDTEGKGVEG